MLKDQKEFFQSNLIVAGLDEAGRGPWAGPIVACAYIIHTPTFSAKIDDSKKLNKAQRETAYQELIKNGFYGIGIVQAEEIDELGLSKANQLAFQRAIKALQIKPDMILIDGKDKITKSTTLNIPFLTIIKGDALVKVISCASIIAKVTRDQIMEKYGKKFPAYGFENHKGYGTRAHLDALIEFGISKIHRRSYKPVQDVMKRKKFSGGKKLTPLAK